MDVWDQLNPLTLIGGPSGGVSDDVTTGGLGSSGILPKAPAMSPDHPLFWFGAILAVTLGLIGTTNHVRVGPFRADFNAGD